MDGGGGLVEKKGGNPNDAVIQMGGTVQAPVTKENGGLQSCPKTFEPSYVTTDEISSSASPDKRAETPGQFVTLIKAVSRFGDPQHESDHDKELMHQPSTPRIVSSPDDDEEKGKEKEKEKHKQNKKKKKGSNKIKKVFVVIELIVFVCIMGFLITSLTVTKLKNHLVCEMELWKWCVLVSVIFCARLVTKWVMIVLIFLIEKHFRLRLMVLYYVDGLRKSARVFIWLGLVLLYWILLVQRGVKRSKETSKIINHITRGIVACLVGTVLWMIKTYLIKLLVSSRLSKRFFDQIQEAVFDEYVICTCSGPPLMEIMEKEKEDLIRLSGKRKKMKKISAWTIEELIDHVSSTKLFTQPDQIRDEHDGESDIKIENEWEARTAAYHIFRNLAGPGSKYIELEDLLRFFPKEEVDIIMLNMEAVETGRISRSDVVNLVVNIYKKRTSLAHCLDNTKEAMQESNRLFTGTVMVLIIIVWLLIVGLLTTQVLLLILSQLVLAVFLFGNTAKNVFEAIIFLFLTHPFDVGDRCVIDGVQMVVEEMHVLTTTFLRYDNEKIFYPNSVLATKPISNFYRSTVDMRDAVEFAIDVFTPLEKIAFLKSKIQKYLQIKPQHWSANHSVVVKQIKDEKMIMGLYVTHIIIFENYEEKINRRSELVLELKRIFEEAGIRIYHVLPQEVHVCNLGSATSAVPPPEE